MNIFLDFDKNFHDSKPVGKWQNSQCPINVYFLIIAIQSFTNLFKFVLIMCLDTVLFSTTIYMRLL